MEGVLNQARFRRRRRLLFVVLALGYLLVFFHRLCPAVVAVDLMREFRAGGWLVGLLASAYFYPYALMQIPSGLLSDTWGSRKTITVFFVLAGLGSLAFGLAGQAWTAIGARVLVGLGVAMFFVPTLKILTRWFGVTEFAPMTGVLMAVGGLGALASTTPLAWLSEAVGWRGSFLAIGAATVLLAGIIWFVVRNTPQELGLPGPDESGTTAADGPRRSAREAVGLVLRERNFWALSIWFFCTCGISFSFAGLWGGPFFMEAQGLSKTQAGHALSVQALAMILGSPGLSLLSERVCRARKPVLTGTALLLFLLTLPLVFFPEYLTGALLYLWSFLLGLSSSAIASVGFAAAKEPYPLDIAGTAVGLVNFAPFLGGAVMQPLLGALLDAWGQGPAGYPAEAYRQAFSCYIGFALLALLAALSFRETLTRPRADIWTGETVP